MHCRGRQHTGGGSRRPWGDVHSREIEDNSAKKGLVAIVLDNSTLPGARIVPWSLAGTDPSKIPPSASRFLGVVHQGGVDDRTVGVQVTFLEAVQDNARCRRDDLQTGVHDVGTWVQGYVDFSGPGLRFSL